MISHIRDEQPFFDGIVGDARRSSELGRPDTALTAMKILLPDDDGCGGVGVGAVRMDVEDQNAMVRRIGDEQSLPLFVAGSRRHHPGAIGTDATLGRSEILLPDDNVRCRIGFHFVGMRREDKNAVVEAFDAEQTLRGRIEDRDRPGKVELVLAGTGFDRRP